MSAIAIDRDTADMAFGVGRLWHRDGQYAVFERGRGFVLFDVLQRDAPFEAAVVPLAEATVFVFRF